MMFFKIQNHESYLQFKIEQAEQLKDLKNIEQKLHDQIGSKEKYYYEGYSWPIQSNSKFLIDHKYSNLSEINFRERLVCQKTKFNNRIRGAIHVFEELLSPNLSDEIYITEQYSLLYKWLKKNIQTPLAVNISPQALF